jgi:hypothetical protein
MIMSDKNIMNHQKFDEEVKHVAIYETDRLGKQIIYVIRFS